MQLYEYQAKAILQSRGIPVPAHAVAETAARARELAYSLGAPVVLKAQVPVGGRGKAGGVKFLADLEAVGPEAQSLLAMNLRGFPVRRVLVEQRLDIAKEYYLGFAIDPTRRRAICMISAAGGVEVEGATETIHRVELDPYLGLMPYQVVALATAAGIMPAALPQVVQIAMAAHGLFRDYHALLLEINPLVLTAAGSVVAADARMNLDDNALDRHPEIKALVESHPEEFPAQYRKLTQSFDYVALDPQGSIGLISSGAGLTMATIDQIQAEGGRVYNFSDVRTGQLKGKTSRLLQVFAEFRNARQLKAVMVHVFAGTTDLAEFADTLIRAVEEFDGTLPPVVVRCLGTNEQEGIRRLRAAGFFVTRDLNEAVAEVVRIGGEARGDSAP